MLVINKIQLTGRVGRVSTRDYQDKRFVTMRISVPEKYTKQDQQQQDMWLSVVVNGKAAEFAEKFVAIGDYILVEGRLKEREYQDKQGIDRTEYQVYANEVQIVLKKQEKPAEEAPAPVPGRTTVQRPLFNENGETVDEDMPF